MGRFLLSRLLCVSLNRKYINNKLRYQTEIASVLLGSINFFVSRHFVLVRLAFFPPYVCVFLSFLSYLVFHSHFVFALADSFGIVRGLTEPMSFGWLRFSGVIRMFVARGFPNFFIIFRFGLLWICGKFHVLWYKFRQIDRKTLPTYINYRIQDLGRGHDKPILTAYAITPFKMIKISKQIDYLKRKLQFKGISTYL